MPPSTPVMLAIDPGLRGCGCSWWEQHGGVWRLASAAYIEAVVHEPEDRDDDGPLAWSAMVGAVELAHDARYPDASPSVLVVERMKVYRQGPGDPRDLLALAAIGGGLVRAFHAARAIGLLPATWKGQVPREVMGARVEKHLRERGEWDKVVPPRRKKNLNDVMHAAGLGLYCVERGRA